MPGPGEGRFSDLAVRVLANRPLTDEAVAYADPLVVPRQPLLDDLARLVERPVERVDRLCRRALSTLLRGLQLLLLLLLLLLLCG